MALPPIMHPVISLIAGILILIFPSFLRYIVGFYLLYLGATGIFSHI